MLQKNVSRGTPELSIIRSMANEVKTVLISLMERGQVTQYRLAEDTGVSQSTLSTILSGKSNQQLDRTLQPLADYFKVSLAQLRGYEPIDDLSPGAAIGYPVLKGGDIEAWLDKGVREQSAQYLTSQYPKGPKTFVWIATDDSMLPVIQKGNPVFVDPDFVLDDLPTEGMMIALIERQGRFALRSEVDDMGSLVYKSLHGDYRVIDSSECSRIGYVVGMPERNWLSNSDKEKSHLMLREG